MQESREHFVEKPVASDQNGMAGRALKQLVAAWRRAARSSVMLRGAAGCGRRWRSREAHTRLANPDYLPNDPGRAALLERQRCRAVVRSKVRDVIPTPLSRNGWPNGSAAGRNGAGRCSTHLPSPIWAMHGQRPLSSRHAGTRRAAKAITRARDQTDSDAWAGALMHTVS